MNLEDYPMSGGGYASIGIFRLYKGRCTAHPWYITYQFIVKGRKGARKTHSLTNTFKTTKSIIMKTVFVLAALLVVTFGKPQGNPNDITIVKQEEVNNIGVGGYHFSYEQSDGQKRDETAELKNEGTDDEELAVTGSFSFISPDGHTYRVDYTADKDGFHPNIQLVSK
ncbi:PREDICTED: flexible cuticle protein 12-like [Polistes dominula]|uniref:Flexible cuticle protein 12-like n=2 Tax=Polistes TaxID=7456 RepID=A0ABM1I5A3_POLDO|nr:PREDICTED: flexible cuticle protein 12-like [Polistes dominula]